MRESCGARLFCDRRKRAASQPTQRVPRTTKNDGLPTGKRRLGIICEPVSNGTSSDGGVTGPHPAPSPLQVLAAPTTASDSNRVRMPLIPIACWKIEDIRFAFDSSFVTPDAAVEMQAL